MKERARAVLRTAASITILFLCMGCAMPLLTDGEWFYVENDGADMPVWVKGNIESGVIVLFIHGGPGDRGMDYAVAPYFPGIKTELAMAFWDQRGHDLSQGNAEPDSFTFVQFGEDLQLVVDALRYRYPEHDIFLLAHSAGTMYVIQLMQEERNRRKIKGIIYVDGMHDPFLIWNESRRWMVEYCRGRIEAGDRIDYWKEALEWYERTPVQTLDTFWIHMGYMSGPAPNAYTVEHRPEYPYTFEQMFVSPYNLSFFTAPMYAYESFTEQKSVSLADRMGAIDLPILFQWGACDGAIPVTVGRDAFDRVGTPPEDKRFIVYENAAHKPFWEEASYVRFDEDVIDFIDRYR